MFIYKIFICLITKLAMATEDENQDPNTGSMPTVESETNQKPERGEENILQDKLLSLNLNKEDINFLLEQGDKFLQRPPLLLARKLNIHVDKAKATIEALKCFKSERTMNYISEDDRLLIESCLSENPEFSTPEDISLLSEIPLEVVTYYLRNRPLDNIQKADIKERVDIGNSVQEIAILLRLSPKKVQEYVDNLQNRPLDNKQKADIKERVDIGNSVQEIAILLRLSPKKVQEYVDNLQNRPLDNKQKADIKERVDIGNSVQEIAILLRLSPKKVQEYVDDLQNRPLDDKQKTDIKERVDIGNSVQEIAILLRLSPKKVQEYVDNLQNRPLDDKQKADIKERVDIGNSVQEIAILLRLSPKKVQEYVDYLRNRPLDDKQKTDIKERVDIGNSVQEIAILLRLSPKKVQEYVDYLRNRPLDDKQKTNIKRKAEEENILQGKLLSLNLSREDIHFILEQGDKFLERPLLLATRLKIDPDKAKASIEALKCFKCEKPTDHISECGRMLIEDSLMENPQYSTPEDISLLTDVPLQMVAWYLQDRPLDDKQITDIKEKVDIGTSIHDISVNLGITLIKAREYVESTFLTFTCEEGRKCLQIILKTFGDFSTNELRRLVISNDLKLQNKLCYILLKQNKEDYNQLKIYFAKFEESKSFFNINTDLTIEDINLINQSCDIENLSIQLRKVESVIRNYLEQYHPNETVGNYCKANQRYRIKQFLADYRNTPLSFHSYRMIVTHSFEEIIRDANANRDQAHKFNCLLPLAFYYLKCSLPLEDITQMLSDSETLTTHDLFHLIFQLSDPVLRGFCIEHYSFSNPVPFYYPDLHSTNLYQNHVEFAICSGLWYSIQQYNGLISFGLGRAGWNPIGKSHLLDLIFETNFVRGNPQNSAFHFNSIDIQMTNNLFGEKTQRHADESIKWAFIDCNGHSNKEVIKLICQQLSIALIQICFQDYQNNKTLLNQDIYNITNSVDHVYLFIRDYGGNTVKIENRKTKDTIVQYIFIPNLTKRDTNINSVNASLKRLGYEMLHLNDRNLKTVGSEFIEKVMEKMCPRNLKEIRVEKLLIQTITNFISTSAKSSQKIEFSFLQYYPLFVEYMSCYHKAYYETDQSIIDELNFKIAKLDKELRRTQLGEVVKYFNDIIKRENSTLILWKLSQKLTFVSNEIILKNRNTSLSELREQSNDKYTLEILWREALLSHKYCKRDESRGEFLRSFASSFSYFVERGEPFELIDGDNLRYFYQEINRLLSDMYIRRFTELESINERQGLKLKQAPIVVSIFGPQSSGKSTLLNYCFGCKFLTSTGGCTRGIFASLAKLSRPVNCSDQFLIIDTEGLDAIERGHIKDTSQRGSLIQFDRTMILFCLAVSQVVIINVKGEIGREMQNLLQICVYSLNKLRVKKVTAPQIFFVLNQQADPDPDKHLDCINILMDKLNNELIDAEGSKVSDLIKVSKENLFVLPSAFNTEQINKPNLNLFNSKVIKLSPTIAFADRCADLRMAIIEKLEKVSIDEKASFDTMGEWMEMSGNIWDTIIKYPDIVKYRNVKMLKKLLRKVVSKLIESHITYHRQEYIENTEKLSVEIRNINILCNPDYILNHIMLRFHDLFQQHREDCLAEYKSRCQNDMLLKAKEVLCGEHELNLTRLIYMEKKIHEDKIKFQITAIQIEKKLSESMKKFQEAINKNVDSYLELSIENQTLAFEKTWAICFADEYVNEQKAELNESFENLYSLFKIECKAMENKKDIKERFIYEYFQMRNIIDNVKSEILEEFLLESRKQAFIFPCIENNIPLKDMTPFTGNKSYQYLPHDKLYKTQTDIFLRTKLILPSWIPKECTPLIKYCSGYYNHPDIQWKAWHIQKQILCLASNLKSSRDNDKSSWEVLIDDISVIKTFAEEDPNVSPATVKKMVNHLCHLINVVNYELSFIQAKLSVTAERKLSTLVFTYAFDSLWETKTKKRQEHVTKTEKEKQSLLEYFLRKIEIRKMVRGGWDREEMKKSDRDTSHKFALDFLGSVRRGVVTEEQSVIENLFNEQNTKLSHQSLLLLANSIMLRNFKDNPKEEIMYENHFVVQFICNRNEELRKLFTTQWKQVQDHLYFKIKSAMNEKFDKKLAPIKEILKTLLADLVKSHSKAEISEHKAFDSDSNFDIVDMIACDIDSKLKLKQSPFRAMMLYLQAYLDPKIPSEEFNELFRNEFEVDGIKMKISDTYKLCNKPFDPKQVLNEEIFQKLNYIEMFSFENIFNIFDFVTQFLHVIDSNSFELTEKDFEDMVRPIKENFERDAIGCPNQCPSCGKLCERELHPEDGLCQIKTGHQICSMGGKVWNNDEDKTAVLYMCDDYQNYTNVIIQGRPSTWKHFQDTTQDQWDWTMPQDEEYLVLQKNNRKFMKDIWNKFGKGILNYYSTGGTKISFVPYTSSGELCKALTLKYYICFVIDGTVSMATEIKKTRVSVGQFIDEYKQLAHNSEFRVVIYRDHCDKHVMETFPKHKFTTKHTDIQDFLSSVRAVGGGDFPEASLDGLATAATESEWKSTGDVKNIVIHIYDAPPHGNFPEYTSHDPKSNKTHCCCCNHGTICRFDWDRDVWDNFKKFNILYNGINTGQGIPEFEATMKAKLGDFCGEFQTVGQEKVDEAVMQIFIRT